MEVDSADVGSRLEVQDLLTRLFVSIDEGRWEDVADCFSEKVLIDLSSTGAGKPTRTTRKKAVEALQTPLKGLAAVHHQLGNGLVQVGEAEASAFCYCTESDYLPNETGESTLTSVGSYDFHLSRESEGWKVEGRRSQVQPEVRPRQPAALGAGQESIEERTR
jgi:hypothetical protein